MRNISVMIKPASSLCNLRCKYCFYANVIEHREVRSYGIMPLQTMEAVLGNIRSDLCPGDRITIAFQGGEPTIAGLEWFQAFTGITNGWDGIRVSYALQTNATLLDDDWCDFLKRHRFLVGVSWDILPECHNSARVDPAGNGTHRRVLDGIALLNKWHVEYNILCTLTNFVARHPNQVWKQLTQHNIRYVQFTPCLDELDKPGQSIYALAPKRFASFFNRIFELWYEDYRRGQYRSVKLFDDIVNLLAYGIPTACGIDGACRPHMVVEADGSAYPCDFCCTDEYKLGSLTQTGLRALFESYSMVSFLNRPHVTPELCHDCGFQRLCGGNCKRMQRQICCAPGEHFCGYQSFLRSHIAEFQKIAAAQKR